MKIAQSLLTAAVLFTATGAAQAALVDRGGGLIYDTDLNVTWLSDANVNGLMTWSQANDWAANLSYYDSVRDVTYTDWRLPTTTQPDPTCSSQTDSQGYGYNCAGSEMSHLFYSELGGNDGVNIATTHNANYSLFQNIQTGEAYWSGTEYALDTSYAWTFYYSFGFQGQGTKDRSMYALAVRPGDVAAVPVPAAVWLFGSGLLGLVGLARRRK